MARLARWTLRPQQPNARRVMARGAAGEPPSRRHRRAGRRASVAAGAFGASLWRAFAQPGLRYGQLADVPPWPWPAVGRQLVVSALAASAGARDLLPRGGRYLLAVEITIGKRFCKRGSPFGGAGVFVEHHHPAASQADQTTAATAGRHERLGSYCHTRIGRGAEQQSQKLARAHLR